MKTTKIDIGGDMEKKYNINVQCLNCKRKFLLHVPIGLPVKGFLMAISQTKSIKCGNCEFSDFKHSN